MVQSTSERESHSIFPNITSAHFYSKVLCGGKLIHKNDLCNFFISIINGVKKRQALYVVSMKMGKRK